VIPGGPGAEQGGMAMRTAALYEAMALAVPSERVAVNCDRHQGCRSRCAVTGGAPAGCAIKDMHERAFCEAYASQLIGRFADDGVRAVVCSHLLMYRYAVRFADSGRLRVILDIHNVESVLSRDIWKALPDGSVQKRWGHSESYVASVRAVEHSAVSAADELWTCSEHDRALLISTFGLDGSKVVVVPNAVRVTGPPRAAKPSRIIFTGRLDYYPNTQAALFLMDEVAPRLRALGCQVPIVIAGANPPLALCERARPDGVTVLPDPESMSVLIDGSIMAVPLTIGGGTRFKILEAFRCGAPVVSTAKGAEGLDITAGVHYLRGEDADGFAGALRELTRNAPVRESLSAAAWRLVRDRYSTAALRASLASTLLTDPVV
jgi:glycosyltransferase involved in cell wall biosynthesis